MSDPNDFINTFRSEAEELLTTVEECVLDIEENPQDADAINRLFRAVHTIKGSGSMFGFTELSAFTHHVESVLDQVRSGSLCVSRELIDLVLNSRDLIKGMLAGDPSDACDQPDQLRLTIQGLEAIGSLKKVEPEAPAPATNQTQKSRIINISYKPGKDTFLTGMDPAFLLQELVDLGECQIICKTDEVPTADLLDPQECHLRWEVALCTEADIQTIRDVFIFVEDSSEIKIEEVSELPEVGPGTEIPRIGELLVEKGELDNSQLQSALEEHQKIGEELVKAGVVSEEAVASALVEQTALSKKKAVAENESVRVPSAKLDKLINLIGELVITQAQLSQVANHIERQELTSPVEEVERLVAELRDLILSVRMMPIGTTFNRFRRLVRDLSSELGKEIELVTEGGETELDKGMIDRLADPLVHLIRNSVDHGIEKPSVRESNGKPHKGHIRLSALHRGTNVVISIEDDGRGLNREAIQQKAVEKGLISADASLSPKEVNALILKPGFSTAAVVTSVSGRGVGMDVVKREIDSLRGSIEIDSDQGQGTSISLSLPLTLAIIDGLLVQVGSSQFVIPLSAIEECLELNESHFALSSDRNVIQVRGEALSCVRLREFLHIDDEMPTIQEGVIVRQGGERIVIVVDHVIGDHQTVIKSLGQVYQDVKGVSGATILGDGNVALILDVDEIIRIAEMEESTNLESGAYRVN
jgi:two-component system chemotaxis sensor kinase CheA